MPSIFISYRRKDSSGHAGRLYDRLRCWFEENELFYDVDSIDCGADFPQEISQAITSVKAVIVVIGPDWIETINRRIDNQMTDFVRQEISIALERKLKNEVEIFPVLVGQTVMPQPSDLYDELNVEIGKLLDYQAIDFPADTKIWDLQFDRLRKLLVSVEGVPISSAQISHGEGYLTFESSDMEPTMSSERLNVQAVREVFSSISSTLLNWPQETAGQWIDRPELDQLYALTTQNQKSVTVLLGEPGVGKSAILARLGTKLIGEGVLVLAIKADELPRGISTLNDLDDWVACRVPIKDVLIGLSSERRIVVLIDQLDALSELMDQHTNRLGLIVRFVNSIGDIPKIHVIVTCRDFEFRHDVRFNSLNADQMLLARPSWNVVESLLEDHGFNTSGWSNEVRSVLSTPQNLAMFLQHLSDEKDEPIYTSYQSLLAQIIEKRIQKVHGIWTVSVAEQIAATMAKEEELWVSRGNFEPQFNEELQRLIESGFLIHSKDQLSISFRHQTVFEFLRARAFLRDGESLVKFIVEEKRQSLFVRPILWSTLNYLRASAVAVYRKQFKELWTTSDLRTHIRNLLVKFLGQLENPDDQEACWLLPKLENHKFKLDVLNAIAGSPGWFDRIKSQLPNFLCAPHEQVSQVVIVLAKAVSFEPNTVLKLVENYWVRDVDYLDYALTVMKEFRRWDEQSVEIVCKLVDHAPQNSYFIQTIAVQISECRPDLAPKVIFRYLQARTVKIDQVTENHRTQLPAEQSELENWGTKDLTQYENLINGTWSKQIEDIALRNPKAFVKEMWPWLVSMFSRLVREDSPYRNTYKTHFGSAFKRETGEHQHLQTSMQAAIRGFAETNIDDFLSFLEQKKNDDLYVVHQLISLGLERIASQQPTLVLQYLLDDSRRFAIGDNFNEHRYTQALISAAVPNLPEVEVLRLETAIKEWNLFVATSKVKDTMMRRILNNQNRIRRLKLLRVIPFDQLSSSGQKLINEEARAFPGSPSGYGLIVGGFVGSAMSSAQMDKATDEEIIALFDILTDATEWKHPLRPRADLVGGSIQASREFAKFARNSPERALRLIPRFQHEKSERPAGEALVALADGNTPPKELITCIHKLDKRGFASDHFRSSAAHCLSKIADRNTGLNNETCNLLERWIKDWEPVADATFAVESSHAESQQSILWDDIQSHDVPEGNFVFFVALMRGILNRNPSAINQWIGVLERHLQRREDPVVWQLLAEDFRRLFGGDKERATKFVESFLSRYPCILNTNTGVILIAGTMPWLPESIIDRTVKNWMSGSWQYGPQSAGEILALNLCRNPDDTNIHREIEQVLWGDENDDSCLGKVQAGIAYTFVEAWFEPALRSLTTKYLVRLLSLENETVDNALKNRLSTVETFPADEYTQEILEALILRPNIIANIAYYLICGLKGLLRAGWRPDLIYRVTEALILQRSDDIGDISTTNSPLAGDLADLALTLHRIPDTSELGVEVFEKLIEARSFMIEERISILDRQAFR